MADTRANGGEIPRFLFILRPEFPLNALVLAHDGLRIANQNSGRELFRWTFASETGEPVRASNGMWFGVDCAIDVAGQAEVCLVFDGNLPARDVSAKLLAHLRAAARFGAVVGGVDTGAFALARAGLAGTREAPECVVHWEAVPMFLERFPNAVPAARIHLVDGARAFAAGGVATLDMMLDLIERFHGTPLAGEVANALVHSRRPGTAPQRADGAGGEVVSLARRLVALMEERLDFPLTLPELAAALGISPRTLSRECQRAFGEPPMRLYLHIRLQAARNFLFYDEMSIKEVALACGFSYPAVFSRVFRKRFGASPRAFREALRRSQSLGMRPEIRRLIRTPPEVATRATR